MTVEQLLEKYKKKYPNVPYEIGSYGKIISEKNGKLHSYGDAPAIAIVWPDEKQWYRNGKLHRENDKPAVINSNGKKWWYEGELHRENDKPAIIWSNGEKEYWYHGKEYSLPEQDKKQINKLTTKKSSKQKQREDLLKEFVNEIKTIHL